MRLILLLLISGQAASTGCHFFTIKFFLASSVRVAVCGLVSKLLRFGARWLEFLLIIIVLFSGIV